MSLHYATASFPFCAIIHFRECCSSSTSCGASLAHHAPVLATICPHVLVSEPTQVCYAYMCPCPRLGVSPLATCHWSSPKDSLALTSTASKGAVVPPIITDTSFVGSHLQLPLHYFHRSPPTILSWPQALEEGSSSPPIVAPMFFVN